MKVDQLRRDADMAGFRKAHGPKLGDSSQKSSKALPSATIHRQDRSASCYRQASTAIQGASFHRQDRRARSIGKAALHPPWTAGPLGQSRALHSVRQQCVGPWQFCIPLGNATFRCVLVKGPGGLRLCLVGGSVRLRCGKRLGLADGSSRGCPTGGSTEP